MIKLAKSKLVYLVYISCVLSLSAILLGFDTSVIYGVKVILAEDFNLNNLQLNILVSILLSGAVIGALVMGKYTDKAGCKPTLLISAILLFIGTIFMSQAMSINMLFVSCFILSLAIGIVSFAVPNYIAEVSPPNIRGKLISIFQLFITIGVLATFIVNHYMYIDHLSWRIVFMASSVIALIFFIGILFLPESPRYLVLIGRNSDAITSFTKLHGNNYHVELAEVKSVVVNKKYAQNFWSKTNLPTIAIALTLNLLSAFSGIGAVVYFTPEILAPLGNEIHPLHIMELIGGLNFFVTLFGLLIVDRVGRRKLMLFGSFIMVVALIVLSINKNNPGFFLDIDIIALFAAVIAFAISFGLLSWLIIMEIFPLGLRGRGAAIGVSGNWLGNLLVVWFFPLLVTLVHQRTVFLIFTFTCLLSFIFCLKYLPETKNTTLEKINQENHE